MDLAYAAADLLVSRAGAMTCSEILATGKPAILVIGQCSRNKLLPLDKNCSNLLTRWVTLKLFFVFYFFWLL